MIPRRQDPKENALLQRMLKRLKAGGIKVSFQPKSRLGKRLASTGYFYENKLAVAHRSKFWFEIFIHEFCHWRQQEEGTIWFTPTGDRAWESFNGWLWHECNPSPERLMECAWMMAQCELDAEQRVVRIAKRLALPTIDIPDYIKGANAYVYSFEAMRLLRKAADRKPVYRCKGIMKMMPERFIRKDRVDRLPEGYLELYAQHCVKR